MKVKLTKFKLIKYSKCKWENNFVTNIVMANEFNSFCTIGWVAILLTRWSPLRITYLQSTP